MANHSGIIDSGAFFQIVPTTKKIIVPAGYKIIGAVNDHNSEQITFRCPKLIDGHNIAECTRKFVVWENARGDRDRDLLGDISVDESDNGYAYFRWTISDLITAAEGYIKFAVSFEDIESGKTVYSWSTATCTDCHVIDTLATKSPSRVEGSIPEGYAKVSATGISFGANGSYDTVFKANDGNMYAYPKVTVSVPNAEPKLYSETFTKNDTYYPENGNDGFDRVTVDVVPDTEQLTGEITKSDLKNGKYTRTPTDGKYFSKVELEPKLQSKTGNNAVWVTGSGQSITPDEGYMGLSEVTVNLSIAAPKYQEKTADVNDDIIRPDLGYDALSAVQISIPTEEGECTPSEEQQKIEPKKDGALFKSVTVNPIPKEYKKPSGTLPITSNGNGQSVAGYAYVNVNVPSEAKPEEVAEITSINFANGDMGVNPKNGMVFSSVKIYKPENLKPENIRAGVTIAGITGTYEGATGGESGGGATEITGDKMYVGRTTAMAITGVSALKDVGNTKLESTTWSFTTKGAGYIYLCIPTERGFTVTQSGFPVSLTNGGNFEIDGVQYTAWRTGTPQTADTYVWNITIY